VFKISQIYAKKVRFWKQLLVMFIDICEDPDWSPLPFIGIMCLQFKQKVLTEHILTSEAFSWISLDNNIAFCGSFISLTTTCLYFIICSQFMIIRIPSLEVHSPLVSFGLMYFLYFLLEFFVSVMQRSCSLPWSWCPSSVGFLI
jgi:hypothetical protein